MSQRDDFVNVQLTKVGYAYSQGSSRCTGDHGYFDCSGLQCFALNYVGIQTSCTNSSTLAEECHHAVRPQWMIDEFGPGVGTQITFEQAQRTRGAWAFHGPDEGRQGWGNSGHIKCSLGTGASVEAYDTAEGVIIGHFLDPNVTYCALPPGMTGFDSARTLSDGAPMGMTAAMIVPKSHALQHGPLAGRYPFVGMILQSDGNTDMVGFNGARVPGGVMYVGLSIKHMGKLNKPAVTASSPDNKSIVFLASDGGTFQVFPTVKYP